MRPEISSAFALPVSVIASARGFTWDFESRGWPRKSWVSRRRRTRPESGNAWDARADHATSGHLVVATFGLNQSAPLKIFVAQRDDDQSQ